ncbi:MAG TPA: hypothetical protein VK835_13080 [Bacteroidia bacterium]|jgi:hypothetical protein|nr:hypothetical protein [Bacteroidia bacterium]
MLYLSIALFAISAVLGLTILLKWLTKKDAPRSVIYSHGIVAASALVILIVYAFQHPENFPKASIILFVVAALGGFYMFINDLKKKPSPMAIAFIHALVAVAGVVSLLLFILA